MSSKDDVAERYYKPFNGTCASDGIFSYRPADVTTDESIEDKADRIDKKVSETDRKIAKIIDAIESGNEVSQKANGRIKYDHEYRVDDITIDWSGNVRVGGEAISVRERQMTKLLKAFLKADGHTLTKDEIMKAIWDKPEDRREDYVTKKVQELYYTWNWPAFFGKCWKERCETWNNELA